MQNKNASDYVMNWKTIQDYLNEFDKDELASMYIHRLSFSHDDKMLQNRTLGEMNAIVCNKVNDFIDRMRTIEIKEPDDGSRGILYAYKTIGADFFPDISFDLILLDEFKADPYGAPHYSCELTDQAEIAGFLVAETPLTMNHIKELVVDVLFKASAFGFGPEGREEVLASLERSEKDIEEGKVIPNEEVWNKLQDKFDFKLQQDVGDPDEDTYLRTVLQAKDDFENNSRRNGRRIILDMLFPEGRNYTFVDDDVMMETGKRILQENRDAFITLANDDQCEDDASGNTGN